MKLQHLTEDELRRMRQVANAMVDPAVPNDQRLQAYHSYETIKKTLSIDHRLELGAALAQNTGAVAWNPAIVHIGLQFLEDIVKFNWPQMKPEQKVLMKNVVFQLISGMDAGTGQGQGQQQRAEPFILDGIGKIVVEMIKREWPQQWPAMLQEMETLSALGPVQLQIIILVFLRFIEDLMQFRSLPQQRHRELADALMQVMPVFIPFLVRCLNQAAAGNLRPVAIHILRLCSAIGEFTQVKSVWSNDGILIDTMLFQTINDEALVLEAGDFLCCMLSRKYSKKEDVKLVLRVFSESKYFQVLLRIVNYPGPFTEPTYTSFKKFCETFVAIALQLANLEELPSFLTANQPNFALYIETLTRLTSHESPVICNTALNAWLTIWGNKVIRERPEVVPTSIPLLRACSNMLLLTKLSTTNTFLEMDFLHQDTAFKEFTVGYRLRVSELIRRMACCAPSEFLEFSFTALQSLMDTGEQEEDRWTAVQIITDNTAKSVPTTIRDQYRRFAFQLIERLMAFQANVPVQQNPQLRSYTLTCISRIANSFIPNAPPEQRAASLEILGRIIKFDLMLLTRTLSPGATEKVPDDPVTELHRHATNFFSQFCKYMTKSMVERYDEILASVRDVFSYQLTTTDRCALLDGLITVTKDCGDVEKQSHLAKEILVAVTPFWNSPDFCDSLRSIERFITFFGLDQSLSLGFENAEMASRRKQLFFCSNIIASTFVNMKFTDAPVISLLDNAVLLIDCLLRLRLASSRSLIHKENRDILKIPAAEKKNVLRPIFGTFAQEADPNSIPIERLRSWLQGNFESVCKIIGFAGRCLGTQFYQVPNLASMLKNNVFRYVSMDDVVPLFVLRTMIRMLVQVLIKNCPVDAYATVAVPVLKEFCPAVHKILDANWQDLDLDSDEQEEIVKDVMLRSVTKDYWSLVLQPVLCDQHIKISADESRDDAMDDDSGGSTHSPSPTSSSQPPAGIQSGKPEDIPEISALGVLCLHEADLATAILLTVFNGLHWPDTVSSAAFTKFAQMLIARLARPPPGEQNESPLNSGAVKYFMQSVLLGLKVHGQHELNQGMLLNVGLHAYFHLKPLFAADVETVLRPADCDVEKHQHAIQQLDSLLFVRPESGQRNLYEKRKKAQFRKIISDWIGKPLSEMQKLQVVIPNLPQLRIAKQPSQTKKPQIESEDILSSASLFPINGR
ncbi:putative Exportin-5 [Hypsibius exemplaris]|uniref:Exportin-5 n=1 Tax=Hypsibius exemplaris TaxID=2072580 RepID=A0A1W0WVT5_HYPEX|nr:putative Exportin-5 [Hypsibius exemplaris]